MTVRATPVAKAVPFDNTSTTFTSTDVNDAIIEAKSIAVNLPRYAVVTTFNGTVSNNQWLGYDNLLPGDTVPIIVPIAGVLKELTFSNANSGVSGNLEVYKNGTAAGNIVATLSVSSEQSKIFTPIITFAEGDALRCRWEDTGTNPSDLALVYYFQATE